MNARQIKLALTAGLLNDQPNGNLLQTILEVMSGFAQEAGDFLGLRRNEQAAFGALTHESYDLRYERATISLELVSNASQSGAAVRRLRVY
jgi:hypothetical protein